MEPETHRDWLRWTALPLLGLLACGLVGFLLWARTRVPLDAAGAAPAKPFPVASAGDWRKGSVPAAAGAASSPTPPTQPPVGNAAGKVLIEGRVLTESTDCPAPGAMVWLTELHQNAQQNKVRGPCITTEDGAFAFHAPEGQTYDLRVRRSRRSNVAKFVDLGRCEADRRGLIVRLPEGAGIRGVVVGEGTGRLPGAEVRLMAMHRFNSVIMDARWTTDGDGRFQIDDLEGGEYDLTVVEEDHETTYVKEVRVEEGRHASVDVTMKRSPPPYRLRVRIRDDSGDAIPEAMIDVSMQPSPRMTRGRSAGQTDNRGETMLKLWIAPEFGRDFSGTMYYAASADGFQARIGTFRIGPEQVEVIHERSVVLTDGLEMSGRVRSRDGYALEGESLEFSPTTMATDIVSRLCEDERYEHWFDLDSMEHGLILNEFQGYARTDSEGHFRFTSAIPGPYVLWVADEAFRVSAPATDLDLSLSEDALELELYRGCSFPELEGTDE